MAGHLQEPYANVGVDPVRLAMVFDPDPEARR